MKNSKRLACTAYHEAGHVISMIMVKERFKYVSILPMVTREKSKLLGRVKYLQKLNEEKWKARSFFNPLENHKFFELSFTTIAGFIAEYIFKGRGDYRGAMGDFRVWVFLVLNQLPKKLRRSYQHFLVDYTEQVLREPDNWHMVKTIASALLERKILTYKEVLEIVFNTNPAWSNLRSEKDVKI